MAFSSQADILVPSPGRRPGARPSRPERVPSSLFVSVLPVGDGIGRYAEHSGGLIRVHAVNDSVHHAQAQGFLGDRRQSPHVHAGRIIHIKDQRMRNDQVPPQYAQ